MNRDTIIGFVLIALVLIGFSWWNQPSAEQIEAARKQDSIAAIQKDSAQPVSKTALPPSRKIVPRKPLSRPQP